ncbi:MAG: cation transporter [Candidatus Rokuibacteriota bacterium]|nr:MAG: cation transporter [Candidatus Rokubacteria bacterium]
MTHAPRETAAARSQGVLIKALALTGGLLALEVVGGLWTGSLALLADAAHVLTDVGGLILALFAIWIASRPPTPEKTYGYYRVEILAALVNALVLLVVAGAILVEAYERIVRPREVLAVPMLAVAALGFGANLYGAWILHRDAVGSLTVRAAYLEVLSDALASVGVMGIGVFIVPRTWRLLRQAVNVLLEGTPAHLELAEVDRAISETPGVRRVHDLHVWTLTSGREAMSAHVVVDDLAGGERLLERLHALLHARFGVDHTTIQLETEPPAVLTIKAGSERKG